LRLNLDRFPAAGGPIYLPFPPVKQVLSVEYTDAAGQQHTLLPPTTWQTWPQPRPGWCLLLTRGGP